MAGSGQTRRILYAGCLGLGISPALFGSFGAGTETKVSYESLEQKVSAGVGITNEKRITNLAGDELYPQWSPDGNRIAFQDGEGRIYLVNIDGKGLKKIVNKETQSHGLVFSKPGFCWHPSGKKIIYAVDDSDARSGIFELDLRTGKEKLLIQRDGLDSPLYSPSGKYVAFIDGADWEEVSDLSIYDRKTAKIKSLTNNSARDVRKQDKVKGIGWFPDSKRIAFIEGATYGTVTRGGDLYSILADGKSRALSGPEPGEEEEVYSFSISPDGKNILYQAWRGGENQAKGSSLTYIYNIPQKKKIFLGESGEMKDIGYQQWNRDGRSAAFELDGELYTAGKEGQKTRLTRTSYNELSPAFSPDGKSIAYASNKDGDYDLYVGKVKP